MTQSPVEVAPLIEINSETWIQPMSTTTTAGNTSNLWEHQRDVGENVVKALETSGFLLVQSDLISQELQKQALNDAEAWLMSTPPMDEMVTKHPTDPKSYVMLSASDYQRSLSEEGLELFPCFSPNLQKYWKNCEALKTCILRAIGIGLQLDHPEDLASWHSGGGNSAMRLLHYPPATSQTGNRCKEHSDYGCLTLLSTDGVSGLEILLDGKWWPVPHVPGTVVVNIGSLLSDWTDQKLLATLHRVAGTASEHSASDPANLEEASSQGRTSIAFFVDPVDDAPLLRGGSVKEYISWRSGGSGPQRSGVAFTSLEKERVDG